MLDKSNRMDVVLSMDNVSKVRHSVKYDRRHRSLMLNTLIYLIWHLYT